MHSMTDGDFNRDGIRDLAIGSENTKLHILLGWETELSPAA
jgi:hypothetical protein